ncbi:TatD family hydrolase [Candidatus Woesearchaeota archaeon]|nr:TatD family hydrolase [Candidatus Woesearchaeota archaeon]MCF7901088.1 TatD family hydrolase [Candidatus Woesearchaeota archaeon]MCF8013421.1 TatD family hydrolase [Candidatus Woesearchaeota archaeon]
MRYVDVHAHYDLGEFDDDLPKVLDSCSKEGVKVIIENGVHPISNRRILEHAKIFPMIKPALGYYPTHVVEYGVEKVDKEIDFMKKNKSKFIAIGEVGMDFKFGNDNPCGDKFKKIQKEGFEKFIELSEKTKKPLIIHSRKAELEVIDLLESSKLKNPVMHCFMGKKKLMQRVADNGWNFSISPIVDKLQQLQEMVSYTNINQLLTETDAPYLAPSPGERNDSRNIKIAVKKIAEIKGFEEIETADTIFMNYQRLFL